MLINNCLQKIKNAFHCFPETTQHTYLLNIKADLDDLVPTLKLIR